MGLVVDVFLGVKSTGSINSKSSLSYEGVDRIFFGGFLFFAGVEGTDMLDVTVGS